MIQRLKISGCVLGTTGLMLLSALAWTGEKKQKEKKAEESKEVVVNGELINADLKDIVRTESFCKTYTFKMTAGKNYQIDMKSTVFDSYLRLEGPDGKQVAEDDDSGGMRNARIVYRAAKTGDFQIIATSLGESTGKFTLIVKDLGGVANKPGKAIELKNEKGQATYSGNLNKADPKYGNNQKISKIFVFPMEAGKTYQIDHSSKAFDAYLYLEDPAGVLLDENDDNGVSLDSRIIHKAAKAGKYRIIATSLDGRSSGAFTLTIRATDEGAPNEEKKKAEVKKESRDNR
jgi:hypothetical protein